MRFQRSQRKKKSDQKCRQQDQAKRNRNKESKKESAKQQRKHSLTAAFEGTTPLSSEPAGPQICNKTRAAELFQGQLNPKKLKASRPVRLEQWIEIRKQHGEIIVKRFPDNAGVIKRGQKMWPPPNYVYRRLNFPNGIPHEYNWVGVADETHRQQGGCGIQRMSVETWLDIIEYEAKYSDGRVLGVPNLPRHRANGECQCENCQRAYTVIEHLEAEGKNVEDLIRSRLATEYTDANLETEPGTK